MMYLDRTRQLYRDYITEVARLNKRDKQSMGGLFGFLTPKQDPCHNRFVEDMSALLEEASQTELASREIRELMEFIFQESRAYENDRVVYWMLLAVHALTRPLVPRLAAGDAAALREWYEKHHPRSGLLPAQKDLLVDLRRRAEHGNEQ